MKLEHEREHCDECNQLFFFTINQSKVYILGIADYTLELSMEET